MRLALHKMCQPIEDEMPFYPFFHTEKLIHIHLHPLVGV